MLHLLCTCITCQEPFDSQDLKTFPLCKPCSQSLLSCPTLCTQCGSALCPPQHCDRPWRIQSSVTSYTASYLLLGQGYAVLRSWKNRGGYLLDRKILKIQPELLTHWKTHRIDALVPVPQSWHRSLQLHGGSTARLCRWLHRLTGIPRVTALSVKITPTHRQAQLSHIERTQNSLRFTATQTLKGQRILLIDDFMTTGHTLRQAAIALKTAGAAEVHTFCLGVRPQFYS